MPIYSDAARAFARENFPPDSPSSHSAAFGYDAGHAAALVTVTPAPTPRTITTAAELDALPEGSVVRDREGDVWIKGDDEDHNGDEWYGTKYNRSTAFNSEWVADYGPVTLLVPATAAPEPVRLTDPDDPRIQVGALVSYDACKYPDGTWVTYRYALKDGHPSIQGTVGYVRKNVAHGGWSLLAEAPEDPDAEKRQALADLFHDELGVNLSDSDMSSLFRSISHLGYDVVKRES